MKKIFVTLIVLLAAQTSFAKITLEQCLSVNQKGNPIVSNEILAKDFINLIQAKADDGSSNDLCKSKQLKSWVRGPSEPGDIDTKRIVLTNGDIVKVIGPVVEQEDEFGPNNVYKVNYVILMKDGKKTSGDFSFSRIYEESYVEDVGCAMMQTEPTVSFVRQECL